MTTIQNRTHHAAFALFISFILPFSFHACIDDIEGSGSDNTKDKGDTKDKGNTKDNNDTTEPRFQVN